MFDQLCSTAGALPDVLIPFKLFSLMDHLNFFVLVEFSFLYCKFKPTDNGLCALSYILQTFYKYSRAPARGPQITRLNPQVHTQTCVGWVPSLAGRKYFTALGVSVSCINGVIKEQGNR